MLASVAAAQTPPPVLRILHYTQAETPQDMHEIASVVRAVGQLREVSEDTGGRTLALRGPAAEIALGEWLFVQADQPPRTQQSEPKEFRVSDNDVARVFYLTSTGNVQSLQEVATLVRSIAEIRILFTYNAARVIALRGTPDQLKMAEWLLKELDQPSSARTSAQVAAPRSYTVATDDLLSIFYVPAASTPQALQETAVYVRNMTKIRRLFTYNAPRAIALRGTAEQIATAAQLIGERDR